MERNRKVFFFPAYKGHSQLEVLSKAIAKEREHSTIANVLPQKQNCTTDSQKLPTKSHPIYQTKGLLPLSLHFFPDSLNLV